MMYTMSQTYEIWLYRYYLTTGTHVPGRYAKTLAQANALSKKLSARLGWNIRVYKLVK